MPTLPERFPLHGEVLVQHGQGDVGQQRREDPILRRAGRVSLFSPSSVRTPALKNARISASTRSSVIRPWTRSVRAVRPILSKHALMSSSNTELIGVAARCVVVNLSDRVLGSSPWPEPIRTGFEITSKIGSSTNFKDA